MLIFISTKFHVVFSYCTFYEDGWMYLVMILKCEDNICLFRNKTGMVCVYI